MLMIHAYVYVEDAASVIRCMPSEDATNGFFVSCFVKRANDDTNTGRTAQTNATKTNKTVIRQKKAIPASVHTTSSSSSNIQNQSEKKTGNKRKVADRNDPEDLDEQVEGEEEEEEGGDSNRRGGDDGKGGAPQQKKKKRKGKRKKSVHEADNTAS
jgi:hypothetical protein